MGARPLDDSVGSGLESFLLELPQLGECEGNQTLSSQ